MPRKKEEVQVVDRVNRAILTVLYKSNRGLTGAFIAKKVQLSPPAIKPRLLKLQKQGIIKKTFIGTKREFTRKFSNSKTPQTIISPCKIVWALDLIKKKK